MTGQLEITRVTIAPPQPTDPPELLCHASIVLCGCFDVRGIRLVRNPAEGRARIRFASTPRTGSAGFAYCRDLVCSTNPVTRSVIEWAVLRAYRDWFETNVANAPVDDVLVKELGS